MLALFPSRGTSGGCASPALIGRVSIGLAALLGVGYVAAARFGRPF